VDLLRTKTAPGSVVTGYVYDTARRLTRVDVPAGESDLYYLYDVMGQLGWGRDGLNGMTVGSDTVDDWYFEYNKDGALTKELLQAVNGGTPYKLGERRLQLDSAGRRWVQWFRSDNRTGYLNLVDYYQVYSYDSTKK